MLPVWIVLVLLPIFGGAERFNCRGRILGAYYADAKSGCKAFHVCVRVAGGGIRDFRFFCPPGTLFHQEAQTCTDWGDDDPLACPADLYDGQFDLYKIGSGYDTKKLSSPGNRDEEAEFGLQRAESGDRRLSQNNAGSNGPVSDLRAAHSSDFFSGQRDRGRDDSVPPSPAARQASPARQSFRRPTTSRPPSTAVTLSPSSPPPSSPQSSPPQYDVASKRKLVRKRPIYASTAAPSTFAQSTVQQPFSQQPQQSFSQQPFSKRPQQPFSQQPPQSFSQQPQQSYPLQQQQKLSKKPTQPFPHDQEQQLFSQQSQQSSSQQPQQLFSQRPQQSFSQQPQHSPSQQPQQSLSQRPQQSTSQQPAQTFSQQPTQTFSSPQQHSNQNKLTTSPPANVPPQYKDEYVEVSRVTPKQIKNRYYPNNPTSSTYSQSTSTPYSTKKEGLSELYNYESQSTPGVNDNRPFKVRNSFSVSDLPAEPDFVRINGNQKSNRGREIPTTVDYNTAGTRSFATSTPAYRNFNSVSYEPEKNNFVSFSGTKQNYYNTPTTPPPTTTYATTRSDPLLNLNTVAYNTNIALNTIQPSNYAENDEDDGQYRPPDGEDDGQYRPELYERERELLTGAHSLNIAASGNRLPENQKHNGKSQAHVKPSSHSSAPRPFRPAPTPSAPTQTTGIQESTYTTTYKPSPTFNTQRTFDYYQTYTTTSRPIDQPAPPSQNFVAINNAPSRSETTLAPRTPEPRPQTRAPAPPTRAPAPPTTAPTSRPSTHGPHFANPPNKKEDASYDYAYYDSDPGFSEYDHVEEFSKTKTRS